MKKSLFAVLMVLVAVTCFSCASFVENLYKSTWEKKYKKNFDGMGFYLTVNLEMDESTNEYILLCRTTGVDVEGKTLPTIVETGEFSEEMKDGYIFIPKNISGNASTITLKPYVGEKKRRNDNSYMIIDRFYYNVFDYDSTGNSGVTKTLRPDNRIELPRKY